MKLSLLLTSLHVEILRDQRIHLHISVTPQILYCIGLHHFMSWTWESRIDCRCSETLQCRLFLRKGYNTAGAIRVRQFSCWTPYQNRLVLIRYGTYEAYHSVSLHFDVYIIHSRLIIRHLRITLAVICNPKVF